MGKNGYSLLELLITMTIMTVVSALWMTASVSSTKWSAVTQTQAEIHADLRATMAAITLEARSAYSRRLVDGGGAPEGTIAVTVSDSGDELSFQVPVPLETADMFGASSLITYQFENEDESDSELGPNAMLDEGEDENTDGSLTRRVVRTQDGSTIFVGSATNISSVLFELEANQNSKDDLLTTLYIVLEGSKRYGTYSDTEIVGGRLESRIHIEN